MNCRVPILYCLPLLPLSLATLPCRPRVLRSLIPDGSPGVAGVLRACTARDSLPVVRVLPLAIAPYPAPAPAR